MEETNIETVNPVVELAVLPEEIPAADPDTTFSDMNKLDLTDYIRKKNGLSYLPWAAAYQKLMEYDPKATFKVLTQVPDQFDNARYWFDDGKTGWVQTEVTVKGITKKSFPYPITNHKNMVIAAEEITSAEAQKSIMRCLVKNIALFGLGLYIYQGEDLPEDVKNLLTLKDEVAALAKEKLSKGGATKEKAEKLMKDAQREAFPDMEEEMITGKISIIEDEEILKKLKNSLSAIRIRPTKKEKEEK